MNAMKAGVVAAAIGTLVIGACTSSSGQQPRNEPSSIEPIVLRLGTGDPQGRPDTPVVERFADAVEELSDGAIGVEIVWEAGGDSSDPDGFERGVVSLVQEGELDLGWVAARAWDTLGVKSLQALQAPFLITDHELLTEVLADPIAEEMIAGVDDAGVVGLDLFADGLRYPAGYTAPLASPADFDGAHIRLVPSDATEAFVRSLGARPVYGLTGDALDAAIASGEIDGTEVSLGLADSLLPPGSIVTGNVILFPRVNTLFASQERMASLSDEQRTILADAAAEAAAFSADSADEDLETFCAGSGDVVAASAANVQALQRAVEPVYRMLEADPQTKTYIETIRGLMDEAGFRDVPESCGKGS